MSHATLRHHEKEPITTLAPEGRGPSPYVANTSDRGEISHTSLRNNVDRTLLATVIWVIIAVCITPMILNVFGFSFGSAQTFVDLNDIPALAQDELADAIFSSLSGAFVHTLLEWTAFCVALLTASSTTRQFASGI